jgi:hypothetical protein
MGPLLIKTTYFSHRETLKTNRSTDSNRAVAQAVLHMQVNHYGADVAQVYDDNSGELHAEVKRYKDGSIRITYRRDPAKYERKLALAAFLPHLAAD